MATSITSLKKFEHQVAGHDNLLQLPTDDLIVIKPASQQEREFYEHSQQYDEFMAWIPECYGSLHASTDTEIQLLDKKLDAVTLQSNTTINTSSNENHLDEHLCLENILNGFTRPCIVDIKLGYKIYEDSADEVKRNKMIKNAKGTTIESLGLRISGMKTFDSIERVYTTYPKQYGRERTKDNFLNALLTYFYPTHRLDDDMEDGIPRHCTRTKDTTLEGTITRKSLTKKKIEWIVEHFIDTVMEIQEFIEEHAELQLIGCSLLLVYEGDAAAAHRVWKRMLEEDRREQSTINDINDDEDNVEPKLCDIRLIDFHRSSWRPERTEQDPTFVKALSNLVTLLHQVIEQSPLV
ncbi:uncharacterized protein BX664DRAFT_139887 [Halteromyces radiatus]|uniref:uncharacterized protein n=1 Tax=Halteromyces radiatus TaxID=101107 RepID=UPI00221E966B|nr:uncharacterized protein BX664DRAFT_139887 [Halteromyces radiatus]KAI8089704.1 hypothetical protein BX664DRAFT_139887 [Halteromyces radiatus]